MAQRQKPEMREAMVAAAATELAEAGYDGATLASIAARAGTSIGNLYKYFRGKDELFAATVPDALVVEASALLRGRVEALGTARDVRTLPRDHAYHTASEAVLRFSLEHRAALLFLLRHSAGTRHEGFVEDVVADLARAAVRYAESAYPGVRFTTAHRRALHRIYRSFLGSIASILDEERSERGAREAVAQLGAYHLAGLTSFFESAASAAKEGSP